tara:strand:- start:861 stop:1055 length:195 start_codon:yes stop_codon:yes gene_type:complete
MITNIIRILLFALILVGALCFDWDTFKTCESFEMSEKKRKEKVDLYLDYLSTKYIGSTNISDIH